jgi:hypothetical protein
VSLGRTAWSWLREEGGAESFPLGRRQRLQVLKQWPAELMQPGEGQFHLRLHANDAGHLTAGCVAR